MAEWHHRLNGHGLEQTLGDGEGQGSLACCSPWGRKEPDTTEQLTTTTTVKSENPKLYLPNAARVLSYKAPTERSNILKDQVFRRFIKPRNKIQLKTELRFRNR